MNRMSLSPVEQQLIQRRIVPVAVIGSIDHAVPLASALSEGGLPVIEITLRTPCALDCIRAIRQACPNVLVGAGTILGEAQVQSALDAGAQFGVSPGLNESVVRAALDRKWPFMPGIMTPSETERALRLGCCLQKFFPADAAGGVKMLKSLAGPYEHAGVRYVPLGGVNANNMIDYLALPVVAAVGGSWLCERKMVQEQRWGDITALAAEALAKTMAVKP
jgi:2-dehydro-3-deoxyphosphogluconate aldolase / (4S)-4-hydroxy-2-oxoglutarate aldolase